MWRLLAASLAVLLAGCASTPTPGHAPDHGPPELGALAAEAQGAPPRLRPGSLDDGPGDAVNASGWAPGLHEVALDVGGEGATGLLAVPEGDPLALVVVAHGWGHAAQSHRGDLEELARMGAAAVAMDFRGDAAAFKVRAGVEDTNAAALALQQAYPAVEPTLVYGWSMGGEVALLAVLAAPAGTYDYAFVGAGVSDLQAFWLRSPFAREAVEREAGGTPDDVPEAYAARSPAFHGQALAAAGLRRVFIVHGSADPVVGVDHAEALYESLEAAGQPVSLYVMTRSALELPCLPTGACPPPVPSAAGHDAGAFRFVRPFLQHRIDGLADPAALAVRGTYDGFTGQYEPADVGP